MKKILPVVLAAMMLAGCGTANSFTAARATKGAISAQSKAGAEKGVRGAFRFYFNLADADKSGFLSVEEMPVAVGSTDPNQPVDPMPYKKAMFEKLDVNKNGRVTLNEFTAKEFYQQALGTFRREVGRMFANLDANGDRILVAEEMAEALVTFEQADLSKNGKITLSEFEDAMADLVSRTGGFGRPENPTPPAPPAEEPDTPPAPPAEEPATPPSET